MLYTNIIYTPKYHITSEVSNTPYILIKSQTTIYFRKSVMFCQINDTANDHFCRDLWHFLAICALGKEPADCKLMLETVHQLHAEPGQGLPTQRCQFNNSWTPIQSLHLHIIVAKLAIFTHIMHIFHVSSAQLWNWSHIEIWMKTDQWISLPSVKVLWK